MKRGVMTTKMGGVTVTAFLSAFDGQDFYPAFIQVAGVDSEWQAKTFTGAITLNIIPENPLPLKVKDVKDGAGLTRTLYGEYVASITLSPFCLFR